MTIPTTETRPEYITDAGIDDDPNFVVLADQAMNMRKFSDFKATVRIALQKGFDAPVYYEERDGWRFGNITVHRQEDGGYRLSSINGYALTERRATYPSLLGALRAAWVISHFTAGVLTDQGNLITNPDLTLAAFKSMRAAISYCAEVFK